MAHDRLVTHKKLSALWRYKDIPILATKGRRPAPRLRRDDNAVIVRDLRKKEGFIVEMNE